MPLRNLHPLTFKPKGLSDAIDGTNAFPGSMLSLANLVHAPSTEDVFIPRAAAVEETNFPDTAGPSTISVFMVVGERVYGMIASVRNPGYDEPFCYDVALNAFITVNGITSANVPATQSTAGDWTPPTMDDFTNNRIVVTHPGFPGGSGPYFGWFDISGFSINTLLGNTVSGSPIIQSINDGGTSAPVIDGVQPGQTISGPGIPAGATVVSATNGTFSLDTTGNTNGTTTVSGLASIAGVQIGMSVTGPQFAIGTYVAALPGGSSVTLSQAALGTASGTAVDFSGGGTITISANATATGNSVALAIAGGSAAAPLWGAGNTSGEPLQVPPTAVKQFNGRAYFAVNNAIAWSDSLNPTQITNASQAAILGDSNPVTALSGLPLTSQLTGGIVQALVAFKGAEPFYQIQGDQATSNLTISVVAGSVGTLAPNTLCSTPLGLAFIAPDGLRILGLTGTLSDPIGTDGKGVSVPFINANFPSRMCAAYGQNSIRVSVQNSQINGQPWQEYVLNMNRKSWSGPHSFPSSMISSYTLSTKVGFISAPQGVPGSLWFHTLVPQNSSTYTENGVALSVLYETSLLPDNGAMSMNKMVKTALAMALAPSQIVNVTAQDEAGNALDTIMVTGPAGAGAATWGGVTWGDFNWGAATGYFKQWRLPWHLPIVFKQATISVASPSQGGFAIGNLYMGYQPLGYLLEDQIAASA